MSAKKIPFPLISRFNDILSKEDNIATFQAFEQDRICSFRVNTLKSTPEEIEAYLTKENIAFQKVSFLANAYTIDRADEFKLKWGKPFYEGHIYVQGLASQLPALFLDLTLNMHVFDVTAAPGSKTTQIAAIMNNTGTIVACEKHQIRYDKLVHNLKLQGATNIKTYKTDAIEFADQLANDTEPTLFDAILLDVPCSAEGRIRANEEKTFGFWSVDNIAKKAELQKSLLASVIPLMKSGSTLVYSTCTLAPEENEGVISAMLDAYPDLRLEPISLDFEFARPGLTKFRDTIYRDELKNALRIIPSPLAEGFFIAKIRKV